MDLKTKEQVAPPEAMDVSTVSPIGAEQLKNFTAVLQKYKAGRAVTERRIIAAENWWKLRNTAEEQKVTNIGADGGFQSASGWLHNVIVSKHADAMEAYPEPNILPREQDDRAEARMLTAIVPCVLEQNSFERTYSDASWQKLKGGTGVYKTVWDQSKLFGLGDISVDRVNILNVFWEPGVTDIQKSRYFFQTELCDNDLLEQQYPQLKGKLGGNAFISSKFLYDDTVDTANKQTVIDVYYHKYVNGKSTLQYCKYVNDVVLYATENEVKPITDAQGNVIREPMALTGLYDHGKYPYVFDPLFPIEGSPCGYGFVDLCSNPQTVIDLLQTSFVKNAMVGATPRYFVRGDGKGINEEEFLDLSKALVHLPSIDENALRRIEVSSLDGNYLNLFNLTVQELRETSGNTETSTGNVSSGVTAASAIAALQEASGKGSRDSTTAAYRAYSDIVDMIIELIRQFYDMPRKFRIVGQYGMEQYITYTNAHLKPQSQGADFGVGAGPRLPVFDIKVSAQKKNAYTKVSQNELAMQFFKMGFFNPQMVDQALMCLEMMDFDGKDEIMQKVARNGTMFQKLTQYMELSLAFAHKVRPDMVPGISQDIMMTMGSLGGNAASSAGGMQLVESDHIAGVGKQEPAIVENSRSRASEASQPEGGKVIKGGNKK